MIYRVSDINSVNEAEKYLLQNDIYYSKTYMKNNFFIADTENLDKKFDNLSSYIPNEECFFISKKSGIIQQKDSFLPKKEFTVISGPCSVENEKMADETAFLIKNLGLKYIRGGAFKPRTSPYSFQGMGKEGLKILKKISEIYGLKVITEAISEDTLETVSYYSDIIQIGSRNAQNFYLLKKAGKIKKPVLLKRGFMNSINEFLNSAEYIACEGNKNIILCERGIRTFENATRNTLDISAVPVINSLSYLSVIVDPSHAAGRRDIVPSLAKAALAAGADGIMVEIHSDPEKAVSDGKQTLNFKEFSDMINQLKTIAPVFGREVV